MTLAEFKTEYAANVRNWTVANLKADDDFMELCRNNDQFKAWVLLKKPDMAKKAPANPYKVKFRPGGIIQPKPAEVAPVAIVEPVEVLSKTDQIIADLKVYRKNRGFL